jgi:hypothetical protein
MPELKYYLKILIIIFVYNSISVEVFCQPELLQGFSEENITGYTGFGNSVSNAGDFNNDGYDDIIVGAEYYGYAYGRVYIFFGGAFVDSIPDVILIGESYGDYFGRSVAGAGDLNNDGFDDVVIGSSGINDNIYIYFGGNPMDTTPDLILDIGVVSFVALSTAGDFNKDGYDDVIVGNRDGNNGFGTAQIFLGGINMDNTADITLSGYELNSSFGSVVSSAGDINNDGFDDVVVGSPYFNSSSIGKAYLYYGGTIMDSLPDLILQGENVNDYFGSSVSGAGDINKDSFDDIIIGASAYDSSTGKAYIFLGGADMDSIPDLQLNNFSDYDYFGSHVASAGDINFDGYTDLIVSARRYESENYFWFANIFFGDSIINNVPDAELKGIIPNDYASFTISAAGDINNDSFGDILIGLGGYALGSGNALIFYGESIFDTTADLIISGETQNNFFGGSLTNAGDVNNDGYDDILIGASGYDILDNFGRAYLYFGGNNIDSVADLIFTGDSVNHSIGSVVYSAGDLNNDGFDDIIMKSHMFYNDSKLLVHFGGDPMDNIPDLILWNQRDSDEFGDALCSGDFNNDGFNDLVVGAPDYLYNEHAGRCYLYFGSQNTDSLPDVIFREGNIVNGFGSAISSGDVNNDGYDDIIIGAPLYNTFKGKTYIYFGSSVVDSVADIILNGETLYSFFGSNASSCDLNNDEFDDIIIGSFNNVNAFTGKIYIFYGNSQINTNPDLVISSNQSDDGFGFSQSYAGDINNDGYDDIMIGYAYGFKVDLYYGGNPMDDTVDFIFAGEGDDNSFGSSFSYAGDVNKDGYDELIIGAPEFGNNGKSYLYSYPEAPSFIQNGFYDQNKIHNYFLNQNYPNPFNPVTVIKFSLPIGGFVSLKVFDILGREIVTLVNEEKPAGTYQVEFSSENLSSGIYFYTLNSRAYSKTRKMIVLK